jgi:tetratricopeptide (TPR) repeat protein
MELEAITAGTQDYMAWRALGDIYFEKEQYQQAVECYQV